MPVTAPVYALDHANFNLAQFKNAFALTKDGKFAHDVKKTKGQFYVKDGKLCSANIHGGRGTVESAVTNRALRQALCDALTKGGVSGDFEIMVKSELLSYENRYKSLDRKVVKNLLLAYESETAPIVSKKPLATRKIKVSKADKKLFHSLSEKILDAKVKLDLFNKSHNDKVTELFQNALNIFHSFYEEVWTACKGLENDIDVVEKGESLKGKIKDAVNKFKVEYPLTYERLKTLYAFCTLGIEKRDKNVPTFEGSNFNFTKEGLQVLDTILNNEVSGHAARTFRADCYNELGPAIEFFKSVDPDWNTPPLNTEPEQSPLNA